MAPLLLEVSVDDARGLSTAVFAGADRVELSCGLVAGGMTPSVGLMGLAAKANIPAFALIRPRAGDFCFSPAEVTIMQADIDATRHAGLAGISIGASRRDGQLDVSVLKMLIAHAPGMGLTLNRAFDLVPDFAEAIDIAVDLGFDRIMTSGGAGQAHHAIDNLKRIVDLARDRISIMPAAGVRIDTAISLIEQLGISEIHSSGSILPPQADAGLIALGFDLPNRRMTDHDQIAALRAVINI